MNLRPGKHQYRRAPRLQFTSMIDVVFLLLIFFMTTTTLTIPESQLSSALQVQRQAGRAADLLPQIIDATTVAGRPVYRLGERLAQDKASLARILENLPKEGGVFVRVDGSVSVGWAAGAIQACRDAGFTKVSYVPAE